MSTDEEYLDTLLKSIENDQEPQKKEPEAPVQEAEDVREKVVIKDKEDSSVSEEEDWEASLNALLAADTDENTDKWESGDQEEFDVTQLIDGMDDADADLSEINELLKKSDNNEAIDTFSDEDMQDLINSISTDDGNGPATEEEAPEKKKKKKHNLFSFGKKKKKKTEDSEKSENSESSEETGAVDDNDEPVEKTIETENPEIKKIMEDFESLNAPDDAGDVAVNKKKKKAKGFWGRLLEELVREEEEPEETKASDENSEILKELEAEDQARAKKKGKKEKKAKSKKDKNKKKSAAPENDENAEADEEGGKGKKKKTRSKKKKEKPSEQEPKGKPVKILGKKAFFALVSLCATIIAAIILLSFFLPDYADKQSARAAFYTGDYEKVYGLLYGKDLNQSDELIFERANVVLKLQRRLDSYDLNKKIGKEEKALDALLQGVQKYEELSKSESYGAMDELQALYQEILEHLSADYGISEEEAAVINSYDSETYSRKVYSVVKGTDFTDPSQENGNETGEEESAKEPKDILPEEEDIIRTEQ